MRRERKVEVGQIWKHDYQLFIVIKIENYQAYLKYDIYKTTMDLDNDGYNKYSHWKFIKTICQKCKTKEQTK